MTRTRLARTTTRLANGTQVTKTKLVPRAPQEWECQAEATRRVKQIPGYGDEAGPGVTFTFAADFNAGRRSPQQAVIAKATGIKAGEEDLRFVALGANTLLVEMKGPKTPVSAEQKLRHALHRHLGFRVEIVRCKTIEQGATDLVALVTEWLAGLGLLPAANDNKPLEGSSMRKRVIGPNNGESPMANIFTKYMEIDKNGAGAAAIAGARERVRRRRMLDPIVEAAALRSAKFRGRSESVGEVKVRRRYLAELCEPGDEFIRLKAAIATRQAIGDLCAANDNDPYYARSGVQFSRAA